MTATTLIASAYMKLLRARRDAVKQAIGSADYATRFAAYKQAERQAQRFHRQHSLPFIFVSLAY